MKTFVPPAKVAKTVELGLKLKEILRLELDEAEFTLSNRLKNREAFTLPELATLWQLYVIHEEVSQKVKPDGLPDLEYVIWMIYGGHAGLTWVHKTLREEGYFTKR